MCFVDGGVQKDEDISKCFKEWDSAEPFCWSECWDGYSILGFMIVCEYDVSDCYRLIKERLRIEPDFCDY